MANTGQPLEALFVTIGVERAQFDTAATAIEKALDSLEAKMVAFGNNISKAFGGSFDALTKTLNSASRFIEAVDAIKVKKIRKVPDAIGDFFNSFNKIDAGDNTKATTALSKVGGFLSAVNKFQTGGSKITDVTDALHTMFDRMAKLPTTDSTVHVGGVLSKLGYGLNMMSNADPGKVTAMANAVHQAMTRLSSAPVSPNAVRAVNLLARVQRLTAMPPGTVPGGGKPPFGPPTINVAAATPAPIRNVAPAAGRAAVSVRALDNSFGNLVNRSQSVIAAMAGVRTMLVSLSGFAYAGSRQIGELDDAMTMTLAHMRDFDQINRPELMRAVMDQSGKSRTGAVELAGALDVLTSNGMSAGMAMEALGRAENFALAGGMKMQEATKRLVDVQRTLGLNSTDVGKHFESMSRLSDLFVGVAPKVGSSVDELSTAFTGRFAIAMNSANMSVEEGIGLLGALSQQGQKFRGAAGGEFAAKMVGTTFTTGIKNRVAWERLLGEDVFAGGKMMPIADLSDLITKRLGTEGGSQRRARIIGAGFQSESTAAIEALIGVGGQIRRVQADMANLGGISQKTADMMRGSISGQFMMLYNNAMNVATVVGERLAPVLFSLTAPVVSLFQWFTRLNPAWQNLIVLAGLAAAAAYPLYVTLSAITSLALAPFRAIASGVYSIASAAIGAAASLPSVFMSVSRAVYSLGSSVYTVFSAVAGLGSTVMNAVVGAFFSLISAVAAVVTGFIPFLLTVGTLIVMSPILATVLASLTAAFAGLALTIGIGIGQAVVAVAGGVAAAWAGFVGVVSSAFAWVSDRMDRLREGAAGVWKDFKNAATESLEAVGVAMGRIAGFMWNFRENVKIIGAWWKVNWQAAIRDIGAAASTFIENFAANSVRVFAAVGFAVWAGVQPAFAFIARAWDATTTWLYRSWGSLWSDAGTIFKTFISNVMKNVMELLPIFEAIFDWLAAKLLASTVGIIDPLAGQSVKKSYDKIGEAIANFEGKNLRGPFDNMPELKTNFSALGETLGFWAGKMGKDMGGVGGQMFDIFGGLADDLAPLLGGFKSKAPWAGLAGEIEKAGGFNMPADALEKMFMEFTGTTKKQTEASGAGDMLGKGGPGYTLKEMSMARYEVGGELAESLDYQQLEIMRSMNRHLQIIAEANQRGNAPLPKRPVTKEGD